MEITLPIQTHQAQRFARVHSMESHMSEVQLANLKGIVDSGCSIYNLLPSFQASGPIGKEGLFAKCTGMMSNHAKDQKKLFRPLKTFKLAASKQDWGKWHKRI
jgi:hypothetical protein